MNNRMRLNQKGFTMVEMLVAMVIGVALLATATVTYTKQNDVIREGNQKIQTRSMARLLMDELSEEIRRAGFGMPPGDSAAGRAAKGVTNGTATSITYLANTDNIMGDVIADCGVDNSVWFVFITPQDPTAGTEGPVTKGFSLQDYVSLYDTSRPSKAEYFTGTGLIQVVDSFTGVQTYCPTAPSNVGGLVNFGPTLTNQYEPVDDNTSVVVHKINTHTYTYNAGAQTVTHTEKDGNAAAVTTTIASNVTALTFTYFDYDNTELTPPLNATELGNLRKVHIELTLKDRIEDTVTLTLDTDVTLRNMGS